MARISNLSRWLVCSLIALGTACNDEYGGLNPDKGTIKTGTSVVFTPITLGVTGGEIRVTKSDSPVDGMKIWVPGNSFSTSQTFDISYADIESHDFGAHFNPISPMITIACDGGYADELMNITIPVKVPDGHFAMGFVYDEETGTLEGMPMLEATGDSITVQTRHFLSGNQLHASNSALKSSRSTANKGLNMIISSLSESVLKGQSVISSGFKPGVDDWEFVNYGSYLAPGGHCAGQSMTSMWYYYEQKLNEEPPLFHRYDRVNNPLVPNTLWQDNGVGYRFASVIQKDMDFEGWIDRILLESYLPEMVFKMFAASILVTGEPQLVLIRNSDGQGGHAMVVYQVNLSQGKLYIADPNFPNNRHPGTNAESIRTIDLVDGRLKPYETGLTAGSGSISMDQIGYFAKTTYIDWSQIGKRFAELQNGSIGNVAPNKFPAAQLMAVGTEMKEMKDTYTSDKDTLWSAVVCPTCEYTWQFRDTRISLFYPVNESGTRIDKEFINGGAYVVLKPGLNKIGYYIYNNKNGFNNPDGTHRELFIDFKWVDVYYSKLVIDPDPIEGEPDTEIKVTAKTSGSAPANAKYEWNFGDGTAAVTKTNDSTATHKYTKEGTFVVEVELFDKTTDKKVGEAAVSARIYKGKSSFEYQGRNYTYKKIGTQTWMTENLAYLPSVDSAMKQSYTEPLYYVYGYRGTNLAEAKGTANYLTYGVLYNYLAAITACPPGWHLPSDGEWTTLFDYLGDPPGGKMKETGNDHWIDNVRATNTSGFTALPGGSTGPFGFALLGTTGYFWSSTVFDQTYGSRVYLSDSHDRVSHNKAVRSFAMSIRCLKN
jgi:uncharacterized protein (TIGR02145 family)